MEPIGKCEYMDSIDIHYIYINQLSQIDKLVTDKHIFDKYSDSNVLTKELLMKYVQNKRDTGIRYKLKDILVYLVKLDPGSVQEFSQAVSVFIHFNKETLKNPRTFFRHFNLDLGLLVSGVYI
jgi:hypothetical protein